MVIKPSQKLYRRLFISPVLFFIGAFLFCAAIAVFACILLDSRPKIACVLLGLCLLFAARSSRYFDRSDREMAPALEPVIEDEKEFVYLNGEPYFWCEVRWIDLYVYRDAYFNRRVAADFHVKSEEGCIFMVRMDLTAVDPVERRMFFARVGQKTEVHSAAVLEKGNHKVKVA